MRAWPPSGTLAHRRRPHQHRRGRAPGAAARGGAVPQGACRSSCTRRWRLVVLDGEEALVHRPARAGSGRCGWWRRSATGSRSTAPRAARRILAELPAGEAERLIPRAAWSRSRGRTIVDRVAVLLRESRRRRGPPGVALRPPGAHAGRLRRRRRRAVTRAAIDGRHHGGHAGGPARGPGGAHGRRRCSARATTSSGPSAHS